MNYNSIKDASHNAKRLGTLSQYQKKFENFGRGSFSRPLPVDKLKIFGVLARSLFCFYTWLAGTGKFCVCFLKNKAFLFPCITYVKSQFIS